MVAPDRVVAAVAVTGPTLRFQLLNCENRFDNLVDFMHLGDISDLACLPPSVSSVGADPR
jgi:hypothetical protein